MKKHEDMKKGATNRSGFTVLFPDFISSGFSVEMPF